MTASSDDIKKRITLAPASGAVSIHAGQLEVAHSKQALLLSERGYPARYYVPLADVQAQCLEASTTRTYCPYKGHAEYYHLHIGPRRLTDAAWSYPSPLAEVAAIAGCVAFDHEALSIRADD